MKHKLLFLFSYGQYWLQIVILLCSFHKVLHSHMAPDGTLYSQKLETLTDGTLPPSLLCLWLCNFCINTQLKEYVLHS